MSLDGLRELAGFRAENGCAITLYVNLDPSVTPTAGDIATRVRSLLDRGAKSHGATRGDLAREAREGLKADFERLERYFEEDFDRDGAHGLAVFAAGLDNVWSVVALPSPVDDSIRVADDFLLAPLVPLVGRGGTGLVAVVNREQGRVYAMRGGRLEEVADRTEDAPRRHDQGGWSQARYQRHVDNVAHEHYKTVAEELERRYRRLNRPPIVVVCSEEVRPELTTVLSNELGEAVVGWAAAEQHAGPAELQQIVEPILDECREQRVTACIERWQEEAGRGGRAASGWAETLEAASDARVETLLYTDGVQRDAFRCPACGRASADARTCPLDGTMMEPRDDGLDLAVRQTLAHGGDVLAVIERPELDGAEGIAAILRF
ncbi:MAG TPA: Vms1/Ankzf1 family peptidyl-tRNA hydrolase [Gaiellaceae bacterium]|nr:Vms1/Ankzf1 family peptidyl-tRNA hydrolase [Gaiellaceae bacterium]